MKLTLALLFVCSVAIGQRNGRTLLYFDTLVVPLGQGVGIGSLKLDSTYAAAAIRSHHHNPTPKFFTVIFTISYDSLTLLSASQIERNLRDAFPRVRVDVTVNEIPKSQPRISFDTLSTFQYWRWNYLPRKIDDGLDSTGIWRHK